MIPTRPKLTDRERGKLAAYLRYKLCQATSAEVSLSVSPTHHDAGQNAAARVYWRNVVSGIRWCLAGMGEPKEMRNEPSVPSCKDVG